MFRTARAKPQQHVFVFDSQALSKVVHGNRELVALVGTAPRPGISIVSSSLMTLEAWDPRETSKQALWNWTLSRIRTVLTDDQVATMARDMLKAAGLPGHKYTIDTVLTAVAGREAVRGAEATVFTSGTHDMIQLLVGHPVRVEKI
ncbi:hypothetical protein [Streptomyces sp. NPDC088731]|uniref:hypothetical protein n=1 Tax=Streptomyces sp. NPDC088731 TaxID=3365878 RepID=UPI003820CF61